MNGILDAAVSVDNRLRDIGLRYCLIGGIALQRWGQPRTTLDVDVTIMSEFGREDSIIEQVLDKFEPRVKDAAEFARQSRVLLLKSEDGVGIDVSLGALPFESRMIDRSSVWELDANRFIRTCSAEDLVIQKVFAGRDQDWVDVRTVVERQSASVDQQLVVQELNPLLELKDDPASLERLQQLFLDTLGDFQ